MFFCKLTAHSIRANMHIMTDLDIDQAAARRFVTDILRVTGWSATKLARKAGLTPSTITRFLTGDVTHTLSERTIGKIRRAAANEIPQDQIDALWLLSQRNPFPAPSRDAHC